MTTLQCRLPKWLFSETFAIQRRYGKIQQSSASAGLEREQDFLRTN